MSVLEFVDGHSPVLSCFLTRCAYALQSDKWEHNNSDTAAACSKLSTLFRDASELCSQCNAHIVDPG